MNFNICSERILVFCKYHFLASAPLLITNSVCGKLCIFKQFVAKIHKSNRFSLYLLFSLYLNDLWCVHIVCTIIQWAKIWSVISVLADEALWISQGTWSWIMYDGIQYVYRNNLRFVCLTIGISSLTLTWNKTCLWESPVSLLWLWQQTIFFMTLFCWDSI